MVEDTRAMADATERLTEGINAAAVILQTAVDSPDRLIDVIFDQCGRHMHWADPLEESADAQVLQVMSTLTRDLAYTAATTLTGLTNDPGRYLRDLLGAAERVQLAKRFAEILDENDSGPTTE